MNSRYAAINWWWNVMGANGHSVVITTNVLNLAGSTFTATFTWNASTPGFTAGMVTAIGCTVGALSTSDNIVYTSTITVTSADDSNCTLQVAAGVINSNLVSNLITLAVEPTVYRRFGSALGIAIEPSLYGMMKKESQTGPALTDPSAAGDLIGLIQDISPNAFNFYASADSVRPVLAAGGGLNASITADGISQNLLLYLNKGAFRKMVGTTPSFSIMVVFKKGAGTDGTNQTLVSCNDGTAGRTGFNFLITSANKLSFTLTTNGAPNVTMINYTSTATYTEADGWIYVIIDVNGAGASKCSVYKNNGSAETATVTAGYDQDFTDVITFFKPSNSTGNRFKGSLGRIYLLNTPSSASDRTWFQTYDPIVRTSVKPVRLKHHNDFSDATKMYQETASPSTNVSSNNDPVGTIKNQVETNMGGTFGIDAIAPSNAKRPLYKTNIQNSRAGVEWDGDSTLPEAGHDMELNFAAPIKGGSFTFFLTAQNLAVVEGRKILSDGTPNLTTGTFYATFTSHIDASNPGVCGAGIPYFVPHTGGTPSALDKCMPHVNDEANTFAVVLDGQFAKVYASDGTKKTYTITGHFPYSKFGGIVGTWTLSRWYEWRKYAGVMNEAEILNTLSSLNSKWGT